MAFVRGGGPFLAVFLKTFDEIYTTNFHVCVWKRVMKKKISSFFHDCSKNIKKLRKEAILQEIFITKNYQHSVSIARDFFPSVTFRPLRNFKIKKVSLRIFLDSAMFPFDRSWFRNVYIHTFIIFDSLA